MPQPDSTTQAPPVRSLHDSIRTHLDSWINVALACKLPLIVMDRDLFSALAETRFLSDINFHDAVYPSSALDPYRPDEPNGYTSAVSCILCNVPIIVEWTFPVLLPYVAECHRAGLFSGRQDRFPTSVVSFPSGAVFDGDGIRRAAPVYDWNTVGSWTAGDVVQVDTTPAPWETMYTATARVSESDAANIGAFFRTARHNARAARASRDALFARANSRSR